MSGRGTANQRAKLRIENLSDLVFGLALSLGSIILVSRTAESPVDLLTNIALFGFSFIIVIWIWSGYTRTMAVLPTEARGAFALNIGLLFCVAIEPYLFYELFQAPFSLLEFASSVYAVDGGAMMFVLAGMTRLLLDEENSQRVSEGGFTPAGFRRAMYAEVTSGLLFWVSGLPFLWVRDPFGNFLRFDMWYAVFIVFFIVTRVRRPGGRAAENPGS